MSEPEQIGRSAALLRAYARISGLCRSGRRTWPIDKGMLEPFRICGVRAAMADGIQLEMSTGTLKEARLAALAQVPSRRAWSLIGAAGDAVASFDNRIAGC